MEQIKLDTTQIYAFPEFLHDGKSNQINADRAENFLRSLFGIETEVVEVFETKELSNVPNSNMNFDFQAFIYRTGNSKLETVSQTVDIDKGHMIFFAGRVMDYTTSSDQDFIVINFRGTREL